MSSAKVNGKEVKCLDHNIQTTLTVCFFSGMRYLKQLQCPYCLTLDNKGVITSIITTLATIQTPGPSWKQDATPWEANLKYIWIQKSQFVIKTDNLGIHLSDAIIISYFSSFVYISSCLFVSAHLSTPAHWHPQHWMCVDGWSIWLHSTSNF